MIPATRSTPDLPPLRLLMGGAVGWALAQAGGSPALAQGIAAGTGAMPAPGPGAAAPGSAASDAAIQLPTVDVGADAARRGYQTNIPSLSKFTQPIKDTPQSISVIPRQLLDDQAIVQTRDALRNVPGISLGAGEAGAQGDNLTLRGFSARNDFYLDGMRDFGSYYRDPFDLDSIEVLKGPSSVAFGRGSTGGVINQASKQPGLAPVSAGSITFGTDGTRRVTTDVNRAIEGLPGAAVRLNVMADQNGVADRNVDTYRRFGFAPSVAIGLGTSTRVVLNYLHQQSYDTPDYGLPWLFNRPAPVPRQTFYGYRNDDHLRTTVDVVTAKVEHDFSNDLTVRDQFRYGNYTRDIRVTEPQIAYTGAGPVVGRNTPLGNIQINRNIIAVSSTETFLQNQTDVTVRFDTGPLHHALVTGTEVGQETSSPIRTAYGTPTPQRTTLLNPNGDALFLSSASVSSNTTSRVNTVAVYAIDTIKLGERFEVTGGLRYDYLDTKYGQQVAPAAHLQRVDTMPSTRVALSYHPVPEGTLYVAYGTSFNPSADGLTLAVSNAGLAPEKNTTYEIGAKWEVLDRKLTLSSALFQLDKTNARVTDPNNPVFQVLGGEQRVRGLEFGVAGNITEKWQVTGGYAYLDSDTVKTTLAGTQGEQLANTPRHSGSLFSTYVIPYRDIQVGGGFDVLSSRLASASPDATTGAIKKAPGYATFQAMLKLPVRPGLDLQFNGTNLGNEKYYDLIHPAHVVPGAGRTLLVSLNVKL